MAVEVPTLQGVYEHLMTDMSIWTMASPAQDTWMGRPDPASEEGALLNQVHIRLGKHRNESVFPGPGGRQCGWARKMGFLRHRRWEPHKACFVTDMTLAIKIVPAWCVAGA